MLTSSPKLMLIVDPDRRFHEFLRTDFDAYVAEKPARIFAEPICVTSIREAQRVLSGRAVQLAGVFVNPSVGTPAWISVLKDVERYLPGCPCWIVCDRNPNLSETERVRLKIRDVLHKPIGYVELSDALDSVIFGKDMK